MCACVRYVYRVAQPMGGSPIGRKLVCFFVLPPLEARSTPSPHLWNTWLLPRDLLCVSEPVYARATCVAATICGPTGTSFTDPFSGPRRSLDMCKVPLSRGGEGGKREREKSREPPFFLLSYLQIVLFSRRYVRRRIKCFPFPLTNVYKLFTFFGTILT